MQLDSIISSAIDGSDTKKSAIDYKFELTRNTENELLVETLIKANGFEDSVCTISSTSDNVNVIVKTADLTQQDAIKIYTIIYEELGVPAENVKIIPIY